MLHNMTPTADTILFSIKTSYYRRTGYPFDPSTNGVCSVGSRVASSISILIITSTNSHFASTAAVHRLADSYFTASPNRLLPSDQLHITPLFPASLINLDEGDTQYRRIRSDVHKIECETTEGSMQ
jgi:hypothetical protein